MIKDNNFKKMLIFQLQKLKTDFQAINNSINIFLLKKYFKKNI
jgi:hypothetical protein